MYTLYLKKYKVSLLINRLTFGPYYGWNERIHAFTYERGGSKKHLWLKRLNFLNFLGMIFVHFFVQTPGESVASRLASAGLVEYTSVVLIGQTIHDSEATLKQIVAVLNSIISEEGRILRECRGAFKAHWVLNYFLDGISLTMAEVPIAQLICSVLFFEHSPYIGKLLKVYLNEEDKLLKNICRVVYAGIIYATAAHALGSITTAAAHENIFGCMYFSSALKWLQMGNKRFEDIVREYRKVYIQCAAFNNIYRLKLRTGAYGMGLFVPSFNMYILISMHTQLPPFVVAFLFLFVLVVLTQYFFGLDSAGRVYRESKCLVEMLKKRRNDRVNTKLAMSLDYIRIKMGVNNFVEMTTPVQAISFSLQQTIALLCFG